MPNGCRLRVVADIDSALLHRLVMVVEGGRLMAIALPARARFYLSLQPVDMRKGFDGLAAQVQQIRP